MVSLRGRDTWSRVPRPTSRHSDGFRVMVAHAELLNGQRGIVTQKSLRGSGDVRTTTSVERGGRRLGIFEAELPLRQRQPLVRERIMSVHEVRGIALFNHSSRRVIYILLSARGRVCQTAFSEQRPKNEGNAERRATPNAVCDSLPSRGATLSRDYFTRVESPHRHRTLVISSQQQNSPTP